MHRRVPGGWAKHADFMVLDLVSLQLAYMLAYALHFDGRRFLYADEWYACLALILSVIDFSVCIVMNTMHHVLKRGLAQEVASTLRHTLLVFSVMLVWLVASGTSARYSRIVLCSTAILYAVMGFALRVVYKRVRRRYFLRESRRSLIVVGDEANIAGYLESIAQNAADRFRIAGVILTDRDAGGETVAGVSVVENLDTAADYICREWVDEIFVGEVQQSGRVERLIRACQEMGVLVHVLLPIEKGSAQREYVGHLGEYPVLTSSVNSATPPEAALKRLMDIAGGLVGCIATLVILAVVGPRIRKASPGPVIYAQERVGRNGKRFRFYKIRSMYLDADERKAELMKQNRIADGMMFKLDFDPRIIGNEILPDGTKKTGIGAWLRDTSLDEFPQFFNVLKGDMSLVGPRPPTVDEWERYRLHHRMRLAMKPGITGLWQVSGRSEITNFEDIVKLDTRYICNWSLALDVRILLRTVSTVLGRKGAM